MAAAGCGLGPGERSSEDASLTVTRDYGRHVLDHASQPVTESDNAIRLLEHNADVETRYGGRFVQAIDGLAGGDRGGRRFDWFYYVNGMWSSVGGAEYRVRGGDRVWWDHRDWTSAMRVPAVVGSWPEPLVHGFGGTRWPVVLVCRAPTPTCSSAHGRLEAAGIALSPRRAAGGTLRVLVGEWHRVRRDAPAPALEAAPAESGVFAQFAGVRGESLLLLDERGAVRRTLGRGAGVVAALRPGDGPPTWLVTGSDDLGVRRAVGLLDGDLRNRYAVATAGGEPIGVPVP